MLACVKACDVDKCLDQDAARHQNELPKYTVEDGSSYCMYPLELKGQCPRICFVKYPASHLGNVVNYMYRKSQFFMRFIEDLECIFLTGISFSLGNLGFTL